MSIINYKLGLDIGIASIGWAIVDDNTDEVIESGARLFNAADANENTERRNFRGGRRLLRRRQHRVERVRQLLKQNNILEPKNYNNIDVLRCRNIGLKQKLQADEMFAVLTYYVKRRGISYLEDAIDENTKGNSSFQAALKENEMQSLNKLPCEIQIERLEKYGKFRGEIENNEVIYNNVFTISSYRKEIEKLLDEQSKHYDFITDEFKEKYKKIHEQKRFYYVGPGNENSRTNYGKYRLDGTVDNIFSNLIGKCSIYNGKDGKDECLRASGASYTAQEFNILNDLNNLTINGNRKLNKEEKVKIIKAIINETSKSDIAFSKIKKIIEKIIDEKIVDTSGVRIDKSEKEIFHSFTAYRAMKRLLAESGIEIDDFTKDELDEIAHEITINKDKESITLALNKLNNKKYTDDFIQCLIKLRKENSSLFTKWQSLSLKIMNEVMEELYKESKNQMEIFTEMGVFKPKVDIFKNYKYVPVEFMIEEIYNPVVKRSITQTVKIVNAVIKKYGYPKSVIIEMAREKNAEDKRKRISNAQGKNEKELKGILEDLEKRGIILRDQDFYNHKELKIKLRLWREQGEICLYSGKEITPYDIAMNPHYFDVDHIIPKSISFDDSRNNKVLVYKEENRKKGNRTPYYYLKDSDRAWNYKKYKSYVLSLSTGKGKKINDRKKNNLLFELNITKKEVRKGFIARNLNDTRYACKVVLDTLQSFFKANEYDTKVEVLNGSFTGQIRRNLKLDKDRELTNAHHAIDAIILCYARKLLKSFKENYEDKIIDKETGEILDSVQFFNKEADVYKRDYIDSDIIKPLRARLISAEQNVKFSYKVDTKVNRALCNQTIYGTRKYNEEEYVVSKIKNIYDDNEYKRFKKIVDKDETKFLMYKHDPKTWAILKQIMHDYSDHTNPFVGYKKEHGYVRKYSKKGNGSPITKLKYADKKLGTHIKITHNYNTTDKNVVLLSLSPYRSDVYYNKNTNKYHIVGIKYSDLKFEKGEYVLSTDKYNEILRKEKVVKENEGINDLEKLNIEFKFSLYKNDFLQYEKGGVVYTERFLSRNGGEASLNRIETKPLDKERFFTYDEEGNIKKDKDDKVIFKPRNIPTISKDTTSVKKINVDILGNHHITEKEKFKIKVFVDNRMIK